MPRDNYEQPETAEDDVQEKASVDPNEQPQARDHNIGDMSEQGEILDDSDMAARQKDAAQQAMQQQLQAQQAAQSAVAFAWADYKGLRQQQKQNAEREKQQGQPIARGYIQIDPADKSFVRDLQATLFDGALGLDAFDPEAKRRKDLLQQYYKEYAKLGANIPDAKKQETVTFEDKLFDGFRLDRTMGGQPMLSFRVKDEVNGAQQVFDNGDNVRVCTNGPFNATSAMAMAAMFWGNRMHEVTDKREMDININTRRSMSGVPVAKKRNLMIIANMQMAHQMGVKANITGKGIGDFDQYVKNNRAELEQALNDYNHKLARMGEKTWTLDELLEDPRDKVLETDYDIENADDMTLSSGAEADAPQPADETDPEAPSGGVGTAKELVAENAEEPRNEGQGLDGEILGDDEPDPFAKGNGENSQPPAFASIRGNEEPAKIAVASEPRPTHGNGAPANAAPDHDASRPDAGQVLGGTQPQESGAAPSARVNPEAPKVGGATTPQRRLPGPSS